MSSFIRDSFLELLINEGETQEERNEAAHLYIEERDGELKREVVTDLGLWILYGSKDVTVATQIRITAYRIELEGLNA